MKNYIPVFLMTIGVIFVIIGIYDEEMIIVLKKSINLCLECVGIG
ncbi:CD1871A family CXXC motif-containing protein [Oceanirhabdus seepicola]|nr:CD1871A family CXXC motif-containing protein [Oceanirhabdus seepicola]